MCPDFKVCNVVFGIVIAQFNLDVGKSRGDLKLS
jgi:hypothetical protein